jgi:hypothetical protein
MGMTPNTEVYFYLTTCDKYAYFYAKWAESQEVIHWAISVLANPFYLFFFLFLGTQSHYVAQVGLKLMILLPQPSEC